MNRQIVYRALLCGAVLAVATVGWAKTYHMTAMQIVPAVTADIDVNRGKNGNLEADIKVKHLAKPDMLTPHASAYVVWLRQEGSDPQNEGEMKVGNDLKGELKVRTPLSTFNIFVTAETDPETKIPSDQVVLRATVQE